MTGSAATRRPPWPRDWWPLLWRTALLPVLVTLPLWGSAFRADERFNVHRFGAEYGRRPTEAVTGSPRSPPPRCGW